jgi:Tfp pilus assembly protein PilX
MRAILRRLHDETGIALVMALAFTVALSALVFGMTTYVTSNQKSATNSGDDQLARQYAEAALNVAYSRIKYALNTTGMNPASPTLLGCGASNAGTGASDCSSPAPLCVGFTGTCPSGTYTGTAGTASITGFYTGTTSGSYAGISMTSSYWIIVATGYARNASGALDAKTVRGTVQVQALDQGAVASVWNHVFLTAPYQKGVCQTTFSGNTTVLDMPIYTIGNLCLTGNSSGLQQTAGGQAVDLQVGGKLVLGGTQTQVGDSSSAPITSGVAVGGCAATITSTASDCTKSPWTSKYFVKNTDTFTSQQAPAETSTDINKDYSTFDPGPLHTCLSGTNPAPLADSAFDSTVSTGEGSTMSPDTSGSGTAGGTFNLTPTSSYACISKNGTGTGYLIWNNNSSGNITVSGITVPPKTLAINGSIYFDSNVTATQNATYSGTAVIEFSGSFSTSATICAVWYNGSCDTRTNMWQAGSSNTSMLTLVAIASNNSSAISFSSTLGAFQGSLWTQPSSGCNVGGTQYTIQGPMSLGTIALSGTQATLVPLPVIKNMPTGAPIPPNTGVKISAPNYST